MKTKFFGTGFGLLELEISREIGISPTFIFI
jgi:hypothetical protein